MWTVYHQLRIQSWSVVLESDTSGWVTLQFHGRTGSEDLPVLESSNHLLDEYDLVCDGFVSLDLQQHVVVVLYKEREIIKRNPLLLWVLTLRSSQTRHVSSCFWMYLLNRNLYRDDHPLSNTMYLFNSAPWGITLWKPFKYWRYALSHVCLF